MSTFLFDVLAYFLAGGFASIISAIVLLKKLKWRIIFFRYRLKRKLRKYKRNRNKNKKKTQIKAISRMVRFIRKMLEHPKTLHNNGFLLKNDYSESPKTGIDEIFNSRFRIGVYKPMGFFIDDKEINRSYNSEEDNNIEVIDNAIKNL